MSKVLNRRTGIMNYLQNNAINGNTHGIPVYEITAIPRHLPTVRICERHRMLF